MVDYFFVIICLYIQAIALVSVTAPKEYVGELVMNITCSDSESSVERLVSFNVVRSSSTSHLLLDLEHEMELTEHDIVRVKDMIHSFSAIVS